MRKIAKRLKNFPNLRSEKSEVKNTLKSKFDPILIDFSLTFSQIIFFKKKRKIKRKINQNWILIDFPLRFPLLKCR